MANNWAWVHVANIRGPQGIQGIPGAAFANTTPLTASTDLTTLPAGTYQIASTTVATSLGLPRARPFSLLVVPVGTSGAMTFLAHSVEAQTDESRVYVRHRINATMSPSWLELSTDSFWKGATGLLPTADLWALKPGSYTITNVNNARDLGMPRERPGIFVTYSIGTTAKIQLFYSSEEGAGQSTQIFKRSRSVLGVDVPWEPIAGAGAGEAPGPVRREVLRQALTARKGGRIGTNGKGVIALRFDDAPVEFRTTILPLLVERRLPFTRVSTSQSINGTVIDPSEFPTMQTYCLDSGGEVWNHGATHGDAVGDTNIYTEVIGSLTALRTAMPKLAIDCFAPPGGAETIYGWLMKDPAALANTYAGRTLMGWHALVSAYFQNTYYRPLDGQLRDGQIHYSVDAYTTLSQATTLVDRARDWKTGVVMMWHANNIGATDKQSLADFTATLDYIVAQRDAGNIVVLTKSGLGVADLGSSLRDDILTTHTGNPFSETITFPQFRQNIPGSTRELTATVTGTAGATVTSAVGTSSRTHTIPAGGTLNLRHPVTIPTDVTFASNSGLVVSIDANTTNAHLYAV
ncbi:polysaccharide deacetylase family protein [Paenarthrobacter ureafaciens]